MTSSLSKKLYFIRRDLLINQGLKNATIVSFDNDLYERLSKVYFAGIPVSINIRYLKPFIRQGHCDDRSLFITMGFENAVLVKGYQKGLELKFGKENSWHYWVEDDGWVYDPTLLYKFKKELYYKIYEPSDVKYFNADEYKNHQIYHEVINTTIDDLRPGGKNTHHLLMSLPLIYGIAKMSNDANFMNELNAHLQMVEWDYEQAEEQLNTSILSLTSKRT